MRAIAVWGLCLMFAIACAAQMPPSHPPAGGGQPQGVVASSRTDFAAQCGIGDAGVQNAQRFTRAADGKWATAVAGERPKPTDNGLARVWHEKTWMVDLHDSPAAGMNVTQMHTGQMCLDPAGRVYLLMDRYMDMTGCGCMRYTALTIDLATGRVTRREQHYLNAMTGAEIAAPEGTAKFPEVWPFRKLEQLPFFALIRK